MSIGFQLFRYRAQRPLAHLRLDAQTASSTIEAMQIRHNVRCFQFNFCISTSYLDFVYLYIEEKGIIWLLWIMPMGFLHETVGNASFG